MDFYDGNLLELVEALKGQATGAFIENADGMRLTGVRFVGCPGIDRRAVLTFDRPGAGARYGHNGD